MATSPAASDDMISSDDAPLDFSMKKRNSESPHSSDSSMIDSPHPTNGIDSALLAQSLLATNSPINRPFKTFPNEPSLPLPLGLCSIPGLLPFDISKHSSIQDLYTKYKEHLMTMNSKSDDSTSPSSNDATIDDRSQKPNRRRTAKHLPDTQKDVAYWERRRKNNEAAKRSRDARRAKEDEIAIKAAILEQENLKLRVEVAALKNETTKLRHMLYNS